jgi:hypothetical protein
MKHIFLVFIISSLSILGIAQGNLQFNQVLLVNSSSVVPEGKVWKIESVMNGVNPAYDPNQNIGISSCLMSILINNSQVCVSLFHEFQGSGNLAGSVASESAFNPTNLPIWLPAGTALNIGKNAKYISVMEFNVPQ